MPAKIHLYQVVVTAISAIMIYQGSVKFFKRQRGQTIIKLIVRVLIWAGMIIIALFPGVTNWIAETVGLQGNINAVILTGFILVFLIIFKLLSAIERIEQALTGLIRKDAIKNSDILK